MRSYALPPQIDEELQHVGSVQLHPVILKRDVFTPPTLGHDFASGRRGARGEG
jgi:hypothetical protein